MEVTLQQMHLRTPQAAEYLGLSSSVMEKMRIRGDGPAYAKLGRLVVYAVSDLEVWVNAHKRTSTLGPSGAEISNWI